MIISFINKKGGVGKTTILSNLAGLLATKNKKVLIIDLDTQGHAINAFGIDGNSFEKNSYHFLKGHKVIKNIYDIHKENNISNNEYLKNIDFIPGGLELEKITNTNLLKNKLTKIKSQYDFIFIDCPPGDRILKINAILASDGIIIPFVPENNSIRGLELFEEWLKASTPNIKILGMVPTKFKKTTQLHTQALEYTKNKFKKYKITSPISESISIPNSEISFCLTVTVRSNKSKAKEEFLTIAKELKLIK